MNKISIFKIVTGVAGLYHVLLAGVALLFPIALTSKAFTFALGINIALTPQIEFIGKFVGVYMLAFGLMLLMLAFNPVKYRVFAYPAIILFGIRLINRILFFGALSTTLEMTASRNIIGSVLILLFFLGIWLTLPPKQL